MLTFEGSKIQCTMRYLILVFLFAQMTYAQEKICFEPDPRGYSREHQVNFQHLALELEVLPHQQMVKGKVELTFTPLRQKVDSIWVDGPGVIFKNIAQEGKKLDFIDHPDGAFIMAPKSGWRLDEPVRIAIDYEAFPKKGLYFSGWEDEDSFGQVWSQGQGIDNRHWIPHFDGLNNKITSEIKITFAEDFSVVSNGKLMTEENLGNGMKRWHWLMDQPHSSYLIMLAIAQLEYHDTTSRQGVNMRNYFYPYWSNNAPWVYKYTTDIMDWLEEETGVPYPWANYKQVPVRDFIYGAMENTTATIFKDFFFTDSAHFDQLNYVYINAHEMAHQWFGNLITSWSPQHHWLHESFATYFHQKVLEVMISPDEYDYQRFYSAMGAKYASINNTKPLAHGDAGTERHYGKGSLVLTMLEDWVGQPLFQRSLTYFLNQYAFDNVRSENLMDAFHRVTGYSMDRFWDQWIFRAGEPYLTASVYEQKVKKNKVEGYWVVVEQDSSKLRDPRLFHIPIRLEVHPKNAGVYFETLWLRNVKDSVFIPGDVEFVVVDPRRIILAHWKMNLPDAWWQAQAIGATSSIDRRLAYMTGENAKVLPEMIHNTSYGPERAFFLKEYLENEENPEVLLQRYQTDAHWEVRRTVYREVENLDIEMQKQFYRQGVQDINESVRSLCLQRLLEMVEDDERKFLLKQSAPSDDYDMGVFRFIWLKESLKYDEANRDSLLQVVEHYMRPRFPGNWRLSALEILEENDHWTDEGLKWLIEGYLHFDRPLRRESERVLLQQLKTNPKQLGRLMKQRVNSPQQLEKMIKLVAHE